jgi:hypothetical protein
MAEGDEWKTAIRMRHGLVEHLGCHLSSEGIAKLPAKIQSMENWAELRISPVKIQPIENWAELRSIKNVLQFLGFANSYLRQRFSQSTIGLSREASRTFSSSRAL